MILPKRNEGDLEEVPEELRKEMRFVLVDTIDHLLKESLTSPLAEVNPERLAA